MPTEKQDPSARHRIIVLDSFAWIEYFDGSSAGEKVQNFLEREHVVTPAVVVVELSEKYQRLNREFASKYDFLRTRTRIVPLEEGLARAAGEINFERKKIVKGWGMADSMILATARRSGSKIVTGDPHFKDLAEETIML